MVVLYVISMGSRVCRGCRKAYAADTLSGIMRFDELEGKI